MGKEMTIIEAKFEAQKLAFAPFYFQAVMSLKDMGILPLIAKKRKGITLSEIAQELSISDYGVGVLLEAAACVDIVDYIDKDTVKLTKIGHLLNSDKMTNINLDFMKYVCYDGIKHLGECIKTGKPEGLKEIGDWSTLYEGLAHFPEKVRDSWLDFDHYYSDDAFPEALKIVFKEKPKYLFDIGGNTGKWAMQCCGYDPGVRLKILDLPGQLKMARANAQTKNLQDRIDFHQIDLLDEFQKIPQGADAVWMSQFLDCFSKNEILQILKNVHQAVDQNANIYILEPFIDNQEFEAASYCLVATSLYFTTMANGNSKMYGLEVMKDLVKEAGFEVMEIFELIGNSYQTILK
jgi:hypothetical protein